MFNIYLVVDLIVVIALIVLALAVLLKNGSVVLNRIFALFVASVSIWILANYISNDTKNSARAATIADYFVFAFSYTAALSLLYFVIILAADNKARQIFRNFFIPLSLVNILAITPLVSESVKVQGSVYAVRFGIGAPVYFITLLGMLIGVMFVLRKNTLHSVGLKKKRLKVLARSLWLTLPLLLLAEFILPAITGWFGLTNVGILAMLILVFGLFYGVVRAQLFDLRLIIIRSIVYAFTLGFISISYGFLSNFVSVLVAKHTLNSFLIDGSNAVLIIIVALTYNPLKDIFNRATNSIFYRDAYDPQLFIQRLNRVIVENIELNQLQKNVASVIADNFKAEFCSLYVKHTQYRGQRLDEFSEDSFSSVDVGHLIVQLMRLKEQVIVTDILSPEHAELQSLLNKNNIAAVAHITANNSSGTQSLGFIVLGNKKSGNAYGSQDITLLEITSHELLIAIQNSLRFEEIQNFNLTLQAKVSAATKELRRANERLQALDETKDDFISMASHQLRTPLTSVKGYLSMVLEGDAGPVSKPQKQMLNQAFVSSQRMVFLIADLLNVSRLKTGKFIIDDNPVDLIRITEEEIEQLKETAQARNLTLKFEHPKTITSIALDETKIRQVIMNFIDNAIYYTPSGGKIIIELEEKPYTLALRVIDNGIGVPSSERPHLFTKFYRAGNARKARPDGTGLGLFMAKKVIVAEGGSILFDTQEGQGSTFGFTFNKSKAVHHAPTSILERK